MISRLSHVILASALAACAHPSIPADPSPAPAVTSAVQPPTPSPIPTPAPVPAPSAEIASGYDRPPSNVLEVLHAPAPPEPDVSPTRETILLVSWVEFPPMAQIAEPFLKLAGVRLEPRTRRKHDTPGGYGARSRSAW